MRVSGPETLRRLALHPPVMLSLGVLHPRSRMMDPIKLKFGRAPSLPLEEIQATPVTLFVGPNNSGKSKGLLLKKEPTSSQPETERQHHRSLCRLQDFEA